VKERLVTCNEEDKPKQVYRALSIIQRNKDKKGKRATAVFV